MLLASNYMCMVDNKNNGLMCSFVPGWESIYQEVFICVFTFDFECIQYVNQGFNQLGLC